MSVTYRLIPEALSFSQACPSTLLIPLYPPQCLSQLHLIYLFPPLPRHPCLPAPRGHSLPPRSSACNKGRGFIGTRRCPQPQLILSLAEFHYSHCHGNAFHERGRCHRCQGCPLSPTCICILMMEANPPCSHFTFHLPLGASARTFGPRLSISDQRWNEWGDGGE